MPSIYLAGKISKNDWRHRAVKGLAGATLLGDPIPSRWPVLKKAVFGFDYTGPYPMSCDHGCAHGQPHAALDGTCGDEQDDKDRAAVHALCLDAIGRSDVLYAWLDDLTAYGTLAEIGYAKGLGKRVLIAGPYPIPDLWFARFLAHAAFDVPDPAEHLRVMCEAHAQINARTDSPIEKAFWREHLRLNLPSLEGLTTQHKVGSYRLDFAIPARKFAIELDGYAYHSDKDSFVRDRARQRALESDGWRIIRFAGQEVRADTAACVRQAAELAAL